MLEKKRSKTAPLYHLNSLAVNAVVSGLFIGLAGCGNSSSQQTSNNAPTAATFSVASIGNTPKIVDWKTLSAAQDVDSDALVATVKNQPSFASFAITGNLLTITLVANSEGADSGVITIDDGKGGSVDVIVTLQGIDTLAPNTPTTTVVALTNNTKPTWSWNTINGATSYEISSDSGTTWVNVGNVTAFAPATDLADGSYSLSVRAVDSTGNMGSASANATVTVDTLAPSKNSESFPTLDTAGFSGTGTIQFDEVVQTVSGATFRRTTDNSLLGGINSVTGLGTNILTINFTAPNIIGSDAYIELQVTDAAGNSRIIRTANYTLF